MYGEIRHGPRRIDTDRGEIELPIVCDWEHRPRQKICHETGRHALTRTDRVPLDRKLVGYVTDGAASFEGAVVWHGGEYAGYVTSAMWSPVLEKGIAMGWLLSFAGEFPSRVTIEGLDAAVVAPHFYDPEGVRPRA